MSKNNFLSHQKPVQCYAVVMVCTSEDNVIVTPVGKELSVTSRKVNVLCQTVTEMVSVSMESVNVMTGSKGSTVVTVSAKYVYLYRCC